MNIITPEQISENLSKLINDKVDEILRERFREETDFKSKFDSLVHELRNKRTECRELIKDANEKKNMSRAVYFDGQLDLLNDILVWNGLDEEVEYEN